MNQLPILGQPQRNVKWRRIAVHLSRLAVFISILFVIRQFHHRMELVETELQSDPHTQDVIQRAFGETAIVEGFDREIGGNLIVDDSGEKLGYAIQTSPEGDGAIGYSGPTNCLIVMDLENQIKAVQILESGDTVEHAEAVIQDEVFWNQFHGLGFEGPVETWTQLDGVTGATLTSYAVISAVATKLNGTAPNLKFDAEPRIANVQKIYAAAVRVEKSITPSTWSVRDVNDQELGYVITTTPSGDHLSGYQGPTNTLIGFNHEGQVTGLAVDQTFENMPYATYLDDDYSFQKLYKKKKIHDLREMDPKKLGIEGVSGATMTSMAVAEAIPLAAQHCLSQVKTVSKSPPGPTSTRTWTSYWPDAITLLLGFGGLLFSFTKLSRNRKLRITYQLLLILLLGFINGHLLSMALFAGWTKGAIPWQLAPGMVVLTVAALLVPIFSKHQPYCQHICPFGALQQIGKNRIGIRLKLPKQIRRVLELIPFVLLTIVVIVSIKNWQFSLAALEPFDAFAYQIAGWSAISIFVFGMLFSLVSPMAYCRFGCPTGATLNFLKFRADSEKLGPRDFAAVTLLLLAIAMSYT